MLKIGLTGGIASGKSTVLDFFKSKQIPFIDADVVAREVVAPGTPGLSAIAELFGSHLIQTDGTLDRPALGAIVFHDESKRLQLNECLHGLIRQRIDELTAEYEKQNSPVVIYDIPLLIEGKWYERLDMVWLVYVNRTTQIERLMSRNELSQEDALARINSQMSLDEKRAYADYIIDNGGSVEDLLKQLESLYNEQLKPIL